MGSSGPFSEEGTKVESTSLTKLFEKLCPVFMSYGMSYDEYWHGDAYIVKFYKEAYRLKLQSQDENNWMQGMYVYEAILDCSPILHAFSKKGAKPLQYAEQPYLWDRLRMKTKEEIEQEKENERLKFVIQMNNWFHATQEQFKNK